MKNKGFTIIEVLIFTSLISFIFITLAYLSVNSIQNSKIGAHKILATHYGEELREVLRTDKEANWEQFLTTASSPTCKGPLDIQGNAMTVVCTDANNYCENSCGNVSTLIVGSSPDNIFWRYYTNTVVDLTTYKQVIVEIVTVWKDGGKRFFVPLHTVFTQND